MWLLSAGLWSLYGAMSGTQIWLSMLTHHHSLLRILFYQVLVWQLWIVFSWLVHRLVRLAPPLPPRALADPAPPRRRPRARDAARGVVGRARDVDRALRLDEPDRRSSSAFIQIGLKQMPLELAALRPGRARGLRARLRTRSTASARCAPRSSRRRSPRRGCTRSSCRLQPHFLFNTLNGISALVRGGQNARGDRDDRRALRPAALRARPRGRRRACALEEEAAMLGRYLEIQRLRFADRLSFDDRRRRRRAARRGARAAAPAAGRERDPPRDRARATRPAASRSRAVPRRRRACASRCSTRAASAADAEHGIGLSNTVARLDAALRRARRGSSCADATAACSRAVTLPWREVT